VRIASSSRASAYSTESRIDDRATKIDCCCPRDKPILADSLLEALPELPRIEIIEELVPFYDGIAEGGVASAREDIAGVNS
jgi:hypothetical protein